ncbi:hypothetical protein AB0L80_30960, partial [Streptomyces sp. NPDC052069]|uniref:hypothetical protein n=1 Tax=Streptomyces sp. NPDC052069 TaxID=3154650 RepID=UPI00343114B7
EAYLLESAAEDPLLREVATEGAATAAHAALGTWHAGKPPRTGIGGSPCSRGTRRTRVTFR